MTTAVGPVVFSIKVNGQQSQTLPLDFELHQEWGSQDLFYARIVVRKGLPYTALLQAWPDDSPVEIAWGRYPTSVETWYGYINHHALATDDDATGQNVQITYVFVGTSAKMMGDKNKSWTGYTPEAMASNIARSYGLRCVVTKSGWTLPYEVQANESDFQFLNRIADKVGYRLWISGGTLYFIDPMVLLSGASNFFIPQYVINKQAYLQDTARNFKLLQGSSLPGAYKMARAIYGLDPVTGQVFQVTADGSPPGDQIVNTARHVGSQQEAKQVVNAAQNLSQYWLAGTVEVFGYSLLYPGKLINLSGQSLPDNNAGNWIVSGAVHVLKMSGSPDPTNDHYVSRLTIVSNTKAAPFVKGVHKVTPELITCALRAGQWQAQTLNTIVEGIF